MFMKKSYLVSVDRDIYRSHMQFIFFGVEEILIISSIVTGTSILVDLCQKYSRNLCLIKITQPLEL